MNCPNCDHSMVTKDLNSITVQVCPACNGMWLDMGELTRLKNQTLPDANWLDENVWEEISLLQYEWGERECPICGKAMAIVKYGETDVKVDACVRHHGIFLDKGEFEAILESLNQTISSMDVPDYVQAALHEAGEVISGPESSHAEWKDFSTVMRLLADRVMVEHPKFAEALAAFAATNPLK